ncbi:MAG: hypothetical protein SWH68_12165 [Thermodesulfobacteriota bacterium]|nr:hypothetical protein [Thermodesulfobacteriota bacterium]
MNDFLKNLRSNQGYQQQKQYPQKHKNNRNDNKTRNSNQKEGPDSMKILLDELTPAIKQFLDKVAENQERMVVANEKKVALLEKIEENMPEYIRYATGFKKQSRRRNIDERKQKILDMIKKLRDENMTYEEVAEYLDKNNVPTFSGRGRWHAQTIHRLYMYYP